MSGVRNEVREESTTYGSIWTEWTENNTRKRSRITVVSALNKHVFETSVESIWILRRLTMITLTVQSYDEFHFDKHLIEHLNEFGYLLQHAMFAIKLITSKIHRSEIILLNQPQRTLLDP